MLKVLIERELPAGFDPRDDEQAARHARIALNAIGATNGRMHRLCTYATADRKLFGLVVVESEDVITHYVASAGIAAGVKVRRIDRILDPATAAPRA